MWGIVFLGVLHAPIPRGGPQCQSNFWDLLRHGSGVTGRGGGKCGSCPGRSRRGAQNSLTKNILTTIKVSLMKFANNEPTVAYRNKLLPFFCCQLVQAFVTPLHSILQFALQKLLTFIISYGDDIFPKLRSALQMLGLLTISVSIASCER